MVKEAEAAHLDCIEIATFRKAEKRGYSFFGLLCSRRTQLILLHVAQSMWLPEPLIAAGLQQDQGLGLFQEYECCNISQFLICPLLPFTCSRDTVVTACGMHAVP